MLESIVTWLADAIGAIGYPGITLLMALESSFFPFPSEVVLPPAGYAAAQGQLNPWLAFGSGVLGSLIGALFNYWLAVRLGRPLLHRYHKYLLIKESALNRSEEMFRQHGEITTFVGRLLPGIRQLISLPAGVARMRLDLFAVYTALGAGIWCAVLTWIGWYLGTHSELLRDDDVHRMVTRALIILLPVLLIIIRVYWYRRRRRGADQPAPSAGDHGPHG